CRESRVEQCFRDFHHVVRTGFNLQVGGIVEHVETGMLREQLPALGNELERLGRGTQAGASDDDRPRIDRNSRFVGQRAKRTV
ncbi:MAG TPA: hypothetical protein VFY80_08845, partial [Burkholderiales bacterium]|nr:hypothetical protein [Burkholderiales bacterium]